MTTDIDFARMFENLPAPYMILDTALRFVTANQAYLDVTGSTRERIIGKYVFDAFPEKESRLNLFKSAFERAVAGEANKIVRQPFAIPDSSVPGGKRELWWTTHQFPVYRKDGTIVGMSQKVQDVTPHVEAERTRDVVLREFSHRLKNLLSKVSAIARRTGREHQSVADFLPKFEDRLAAMARTQELLVRAKWTDVDLYALAAEEFAPYLNVGDARLHIEGPEVLLDGQLAQALGMAFHELATNAAKYGALSVPDGAVALTWRAGDTPGELIIDWLETGLPAVAEAPKNRGFGSVIIDQSTPRETGGTVERIFSGNRMRCTLTIPDAA